MSNVVHLHVPAGLLGRWRSDNEDGRSEYVISYEDGALTVAGSDFVDGEQYLISGVEYDRDMVAFDTLMPSTGRTGRVVLRAMPAPSRAKLTFTFTDTIEMVRLVSDE